MHKGKWITFFNIKITFSATIMWSSIPKFITHLFKLLPSYWLWMLPWLWFRYFLNRFCNNINSWKKFNPINGKQITETLTQASNVNKLFKDVTPIRQVTVWSFYLEESWSLCSPALFGHNQDGCLRIRLIVRILSNLHLREVRVENNLYQICIWSLYIYDCQSPLSMASHVF